MFLAAAAVSAVLFSCSRLKDGDYRMVLLTTNDVHGAWFDSTYTGTGIRKSLFAVNHYVDSVRVAEGENNVILVDAGDCLQGDNAAYYFNYVDTASTHLFSRLVDYMGYDAVAVGNHDIETGHKVYDRVSAELRREGIAFLAGNAVRTDSGKRYFPLYKIVKKGGLKVALLGYDNANIKAWLSPALWEGMEFLPIISVIQNDVLMVRAKENPDVVVAILHSATGQGDGSVLESEALDVLNSVSGIDFVVCGHDHRPYVEARDTCALINSGSHSRYLGYGALDMKVQGGKVVSKNYSASLIPVWAENADPAMRETFHKDYEAVKAFTLTEVGVLNTDLVTREAYVGMCPYLNLIHTVSLGCEPAEISFAAPLTYNGTVEGGIIRFNDLFTIYPFENQLYVVRMKGSQVVSYLENSYDKWIRTIKTSKDHILNISRKDDPRTGQAGWSFVERSYNFDSAGGINYTVDVTKPAGSRVNVISMASGETFDPEREYNVAMTSYRASGGGGLLSEGAGIDTDHIDDLVSARYPEIRNLIYDYLLENGSIDPETIGNPSVIGTWKFIPESLATPALRRDMTLLFGEK